MTYKTTLQPLHYDKNLTDKLNGGDCVIEFNENGTKCKINDHRMKAVHTVLGKGCGYKLYQTTLWDKTVYFEVYS
tara:strand:- start:743 stop:967 length:225 start_codon:yes stop_codon:yes gene_type:complete